MTTAARTIIAQNWKKTNKPTVLEWICEMNEIEYMEKQIREEGYVGGQVPEIWQKLEEFRSSNRLMEYL